MPTSHSHCILLLLSLFSFVASFSADYLPSSTPRSSKKQAEKFIRELNLFPRHDVNILEDNSAVSAPKLIEKSIQFPYLSDSGTTYYDIRKKCIGSLCYDFSNVEDFLNQISVKKALGVGDIEFVSCSSVVYDAMTEDRMKNFAVGLPELLQEGIKLLVYAGEYDLICNWLGNSRWVDNMEWSGQKEFVSAPTVPFTVDGVKAGLQKSYGPLTFLKVYNAGHLVPMDQPEASLEMLRRWIQGKTL
ncbi:Carboxypeptidase C [Handroanthus impetiginosus]|uniref:Carboxypeptidase C n=1 Tax=Handroanthus impetiginosus TaxID=429701 RepID=A0A2G9GWE6_9LAMI|nr:Carboxypeptidase C [Handroanthus impetiginosus]